VIKNNIQAVIFDFGGVLVDWSPHNLYRHYFEQPQDIDRFLKEIDFAEWNAQQDRGRPFAQAVAEHSAKFPQHAPLIKAYRERWEDFIVGPIEGTIAILKELKRLGYPLYGLSNWSAETFPVVQGKYRFFELFDDILISGKVGMIKPEPGIFHLLLKRIKLEARDCLFIDDSDSNIRTAAGIGFDTILFISPEQLRAELRSRNILD